MREEYMSMKDAVLELNETMKKILDIMEYRFGDGFHR